MLSVREFYNEKTIFITGGSGFMGKVLIEKLLYSCSDLKQILILMRPKRGKSGSQRVEEFSKIPLFQRILSEKPEVLKKLVPVFGDITSANLGLSSDDLSLVLRETSVVFHFAASLNFQSPLKEALQMNVQGTADVMTMAKQMKKLKVMVHLSTAFCVPDQEILEEKIYEWESKPKQIMQSLECFDEETVGLIEKKIVGCHPNTYTYTKRLAEILVKDEHEKIPVCIIRPSIGK
jgi:alcohol-forming fatty acyl-CoA reductase